MVETGTEIFARGYPGAGAAGTRVLIPETPFFLSAFQAPDPGKSSVILAIFLLRRLSPGLFVIALPLGINMGKTFSLYWVIF